MRVHEAELHAKFMALICLPLREADGNDETSTSISAFKFTTVHLCQYTTRMVVYNLQEVLAFCNTVPASTKLK